MTELKTLKDIDWHSPPTSDYPDDPDVVEIEDLEDAAKAWIEELNKDDPYYNSAIWWIKYFFNLDEK